MRESPDVPVYPAGCSATDDWPRFQILLHSISRKDGKTGDRLSTGQPESRFCLRDLIPHSKITENTTMLMNSWLKSFRSLCEAQNPAKRMKRPSVKRRNLHVSRRNLTEALEQRSLLTTFTVNSLADTPDATPGDGVALDANGEVSLRAALEEANAFAGADIIEFNDGSGLGVNFYDATPDTITLGGTQLGISSDLTITGPGANLLSISAGGASRVINVTNGDVSLSGLTLADGRTNGDGAGVFVAAAATLEVDLSIVRNNSAGTFQRGGGILNRGALTITNSWFDQNNTRRGGGVFNIGDLTISGSTFSENDAVTVGGAIFNEGTMSLVNSTLSGNDAPNGGGGVFNFGAAAVTNSTVIGNTSGSGEGGGLSNAGVSGTMTVGNTIVLGNSANTGNNVSGGLEPASSNNLTSGLVSSILDTTLADNGGPTMTHALVPGSAAINAGSNALAIDGDGNGLANDQRGLGFDRTIGGTVDIGAVEHPETASLVVTTSADVSDPTDGLTSLREALVLANSDPDDSEVTFGDGSGLTGGTDFTDGIGDTIALDWQTFGDAGLEIASDVTIFGPGAGMLTISGGNASRVLDVANGVVVISGLSVTGGLVGNTAERAGAGVRVGESANLSISESSIIDNEVAGSGTSAAGRQGGGIWNAGTLQITNSLLSGNTSRGGGGAIFNAAGGLATIINSTITGNTVRLLSSGGGVQNFGTMSVLNTTVAGNSAAVGGGIRNNGTMMLDNSIVAGNGARDDGPTKDVGGIVTGTNNLIGDAGSAGGLENGVDGNIVGVDWTTVLENDGSNPALADNGGPTLTIGLLPDSPAINSGNDAAAIGLTTDQRGVGFDRTVGPSVDIGAFEAQIFNQPPIAEAGGPYTVVEGSDVSLNGAGSSDPDNDTLTYEWDFNYDGSTFDVDATGVTPDFTGMDDGDVTVALRVSDGTEISEIVTTTVTVTNADPAISGLTTDSATVASKSDDGVVTLNGAVTDAGSLDTHQVVVDWGDGNVETIVAAGDLVVAPDFSGTQHTYAAGGIYTITVTVTDDDGSSVTETTSAVVQGVGVVDGVLYVIGTNGDDVVKLREKNHGTQLRVKTKFDGGSTTTQYFGIADIYSIEMHLCDGDDYASLTHAHWWHKHSVNIPATINGGDDVLIGGSQADVIDGGNGDDCLHGESGDDTIHSGDGHDYIDGGWGDDIVYAGAGNDWVWGGFGNDILLGQSGNDRLFGGWGRDIIIAGEGADRLYGQGQDDILITGDTNRDDDEDALKTMRDIWTGSGSASSRAQAIHDSGLEVMHDDDVDKVWGGWGCDWPLFDSDLDRRYW